MDVRKLDKGSRRDDLDNSRQVVVLAYKGKQSKQQGMGQSTYRESIGIKGDSGFTC